MTEPCQLGATQARRLIGRKALSPVELMESCIDQIEAVDPALNAVVCKPYDQARTAAKAAEDAVMRGDPLPALHGLPVGIKDLNDTAGITTTYGSVPYKDHVPEEDETSVAGLRAAGGIVLAKTNTPEFGAGGNTDNALHGPTRNPFSLEKTCGGSSGGSAVVLAADMMPLALGSDTGGSLRLPATFNGIVAFRPSIGVVPSSARDSMLTTYQTKGPMARSVADTSLMLAAMAGFDPVDAMAFPRDASQYLSMQDVDLSTLRVAVSTDLGCAPTSKNVRALFEARVPEFASVFKSVTWIDPPFDNILDVFWKLRGIYMMAKHADKIDGYGAETNPNVTSNVAAAAAMTMAEIGSATKAQLDIYLAFQEYFQGIDLLICPGVTVEPFPFDTLYPEEVDGEPLENYVHWAGLTSSLTVVGHPVVAMPCGMDTQGTPYGIQVCGPMHGDRFTLGAAHALEQVFADNPLLARPLPDFGMLRGAA